MRLLQSVLIITLLVWLPACSSKDAQGRTEINAKDSDEIEADELKLLEQGKNYFEEGLYSVALEKFQSLVNNFPLGPYSEFATLKIADAEFQLEKFSDAISSYQHFAQSYPRSPARPYAILQIAISYQLSNRGVGRDNAMLKGAEDAYKKLFEEYPGSFYSQTGQKGFKDLLRLRAEHQAFILNFYQKRGYQEAYEDRKQEFDSKWKQHLSEE